MADVCEAFRFFRVFSGLVMNIRVHSCPFVVDNQRIGCVLSVLSVVKILFVNKSVHVAMSLVKDFSRFSKRFSRKPYLDASQSQEEIFSEAS